MCLDCGCQEGNERAYFQHKEQHQHVAIPGGAQIHIHIHYDTMHTEHSHSHPHEYAHDHSHGHSHGHEHAHDHLHEHTHDHSHDHTHEHSHEQVDSNRRTVELENKILAVNDYYAQQNKEWLEERNIVAVNLISSPGSGKTRLLEKTLELLHAEIPCAVITGDQQTDNDAKRLEGKGAPVLQIETHSACHLDAKQISQHLASIIAPETRLLFIENVGNLVCPAAFNLGEHKKIALLSVTEGEDKPVKYPVLFHEAEAVVLTKLDLVPHLDWNKDKCYAAIKQVRSDSKIIEVSAQNGQGMDDWLAYLKSLLET